MGPLLFTLFINEFGANVVNTKIHLYADDTVIYSAAPSVKLALQNLQSDFQIIQQALIDLNLVLNTEKTKYLIFSQKPAARLYNGNIAVEDKFNFKKHIAELTKKWKAKLAILYRNKACFSGNCRRQIVQATILLAIDYGDFI